MQKEIQHKKEQNLGYQTGLLTGFFLAVGVFCSVIIGVTKIVQAIGDAEFELEVQRTSDNNIISKQL